MKLSSVGRLLGLEPISQFVVVGVAESQQTVSVTIDGLEKPTDVTDAQSVASLRPFMIAISLPRSWMPEQRARARPTLTFREQQGAHAAVGVLGLRYVASLPLDDKHQVGLYRPAAHHNYCLPQLALRVHYLHYLWLQRRRKSNDPFALSGAELHRLLIFYTYPRPVFLISVTSPLRSNIFPMDLIGRAGDSHYLLALRSTTPSVGLIQEVGRIAMSRIPLDLAPVAYELGKHHRLTNIDWNTLPFTVAPSSTFGIPVPRDALGVTELAIESSHVVGSHTVFVARIVSVDHRRDGLQMAHVQGFYQHYLQRIAGMPLPTPGSGSSRNSKSTASSQSTSPP